MDFVKTDLGRAFEATMAEQRARLAVPLSAVRAIAVAIWFTLGILHIWVIAPVPLGLYLAASTAVALIVVGNQELTHAVPSAPLSSGAELRRS